MNYFICPYTLLRSCRTFHGLTR